MSTVDKWFYVIWIIIFVTSIVGIVTIQLASNLHEADMANKGYVRDRDHPDYFVPAVRTPTPCGREVEDGE